jgi:hypothetical protein
VSLVLQVVLAVLAFPHFHPQSTAHQPGAGQEVGISFSTQLKSSSSTTTAITTAITTTTIRNDNNAATKAAKPRGKAHKPQALCSC